MTATGYRGGVLGFPPTGFEAYGGSGAAGEQQVAYHNALQAMQSQLLANHVHRHATAVTAGHSTAFSAEYEADFAAAKQRAAIAAKMKEVRQRKESKMSEDKDVIPDVSLTRIFKWSIVLIVAMFLGKKVWDMFGDKIQGKLHQALDAIDKKP